MYQKCCKFNTTYDCSCSPIACAVHGFGGSELFVRDQSDTECNTNGETFMFWPNAETAPECLLNQMR